MYNPYDANDTDPGKKTFQVLTLKFLHSFLTLCIHCTRALQIYIVGGQKKIQTLNLYLCRVMGSLVSIDNKLLDCGTDTDSSGLDEMKMLSATLLSKVFLHHLTRIQSLSTFVLSYRSLF